MSEKKWTDDERDEAFDRGMETMQRVALELYRRGREPLLAELEDCRARNADLRTMLEQVTRDRDHVEESLVRLEAQRDEARARCETLRELADAAAYEQGLAQRRMMDAQRERDEARADAERYLADLRRCASEPYEHAKERAEAFRRGAEAMREACQQWIAHKGGDERTAWQVGRLPIPEDK